MADSEIVECISKAKQTIKQRGYKQKTVENKSIDIAL